MRSTRIQNPIKRGAKGSNIGFRGIWPKLGLLVGTEILWGPRDMPKMRTLFSKMPFLTTKLTRSSVWFGVISRIQARLKSMVPILVLRPKLGVGRIGRSRIKGIPAKGWLGGNIGRSRGMQ